jgi:anti-sigma regulatory factor (Ser/Thr protein kinase)
VGWEAVLPTVLPPGDMIRAQHRLHLDPRPQVVGRARRFVSAHAPELPPETEDAMLLLTSELVTNAVLHARTPLEIGLTVTDASVVVTVHDLDLALPQQDPYLHREGGWGLGLVAALAQSAALSPDPDGGKTAWFRLLRGPSPHVSDDAAARANAGERDS